MLAKVLCLLSEILALNQGIALVGNNVCGGRVELGDEVDEVDS